MCKFHKHNIQKRAHTNNNTSRLYDPVNIDNFNIYPSTVKELSVLTKRKWLSKNEPAFSVKGNVIYYAHNQSIGLKSNHLTY